MHEAPAKEAAAPQVNTEMTVCPSPRFDSAVLVNIRVGVVGTMAVAVGCAPLIAETPDDPKEKGTAPVLLVPVDFVAVVVLLEDLVVELDEVLA